MRIAYIGPSTAAELIGLVLLAKFGENITNMGSIPYKITNFVYCKKIHELA